MLPTSIQDWFPLRLTGLISLLSEGLSGIFSSTTVWRHPIFGILPSLWSSSHNHMWPLGRPYMYVKVTQSSLTLFHSIDYCHQASPSIRFSRQRILDWVSISFSRHDHWENHSLDYTDLCWQNNVSSLQRTVSVFHRFPANKQWSDIMSVVTAHSEFGAQEKEICPLLPSFPFLFAMQYGAGCYDLRFF